MIALHNILVATDFGPAADAAMTYGRALAGTFGARLHLLHAMENSFLRSSSGDPHAHKAAALRQASRPDHRRRPHRAQGSCRARHSDNPADAITEYAKSANIDLIVIGTHGRGAIAQILVGSVAERVVRTAGCPVLTVKHPEHDSSCPTHRRRRRRRAGREREVVAAARLTWPRNARRQRAAVGATHQWIWNDGNSGVSTLRRSAPTDVQNGTAGRGQRT